MGVAQAGIVFRPKEPIGDLTSFVEEIFQTAAEEIPHPNSREFDIRNETDVMVQNFNGALFICSDVLVWNILEKPQPNLSELHQRLGAPDFSIAFCNYETGDSYGYALIEKKGVLTRSRLQTNASPNLPSLIEYGKPTPLEQRWFLAASYLEEDDCPPAEWRRIFYVENPRIEVPEHFLTQRILQEALLENFGVCTWDTDSEPEYRFFKLKTRSDSPHTKEGINTVLEHTPSSEQVPSPPWGKFWA